MKRILLIVLFALATSSPALAQGKAADGKVAQELEKFRLETIAAFQNNDVAALDRLLADDLIGTNSAATFKGRMGTQAFEDRVRATSVMARSPQGHWRLVSTQQTRIAQPKQ